MRKSWHELWWISVRDAGRQTVAIISDMNQPLGHAVGNALEVKEALDTLRGGGPVDFWSHCLKIASYMLFLGGKSGFTRRSRGFSDRCPR